MSLRTAFAALLFCATLPAIAGELEEREEIRQQARTLFANDEFADIETLAADFRAHESRTSSGLWKIGLLHAGLAADVDRKNQDDKYWAALTAKVQRWIDAFPDSPTPRVLYGSLLSAHAWAIRGGGWSREVRKEDRVPFRNLIAQARDYMLANKDIGKADPEWYAEMTLLAKVDGSTADDFGVLIDEATWKYPDYYPTYFGAIQYLGPKWHGDLASIEEFAQRAVRKTRAIEGQGMYARIYWYVSQLQYGERLFEDTSVA